MILKRTVYQLIKTTLLVAFCAFGYSSHGQQTYLSNYHLLDSYINPAWAGNSRTDGKVLVASRQQWASFQQPINTQLASFDYNLFRKTDYFTGGILFLKDQKTNSGFTTSSLQLNFVYHKTFGKHELSAGLQPGYFSSYISNESTYPTQYDHSSGTYNIALENNEAISAGSINQFNLNAGIMYSARFNRVNYGIGISNFNINNKKEVSYLQLANVKQQQFFSTNAYLKFKLKEKLYISLSGIYQQERYTTLNQFIAGTRLIYLAQKNTLQSLYIGSFARTGISRNIDAYIFSAGFRLLNLDISFSYDYNVSALNQATGFYGATELVIQYFIQRKLPERKLIPCERI